MHIHCLLFEGYETLDLMGPVQLLSHAPGACLHYGSRAGGLVVSRQGFGVQTHALPARLPAGSVLLVPGGQGTRALVSDTPFLQALRGWADSATVCLSVCTGAALLAACGALDGEAATSNKKAFDWVRAQGPAVRWQAVARWVRSGKFYTSSGVSAGMDMALAFVADTHGRAEAERIACHAEYHWQQDPAHDPFAALHGLA
ncbi:DJ-1/PfpI family protein [Comamonadaceae bacterium OH2545_COT-014]|nr:DJ-1/PfpI family protein [Comamonadaceae bacterium OH2545_COT-014]